MTFIENEPPRKTSIIQLYCDELKLAIIVQLIFFDTFPTALKNFLEDESIKKLGFNVCTDSKKLEKDFGVRCQGLIEVMSQFRHTYTRYSLQFLVGKVLNRIIHKNRF